MYTLTAKEVSERLGIQKQTVYAYVSRGKIRASKSDGKTRLYHRGDVEKLEQSKRVRASPDRIGTALHWGEPLFETAISTIQQQMLFYRGQPIDELLDLGFEKTAALIWQSSDVEFRPLEKHLRDAIVPRSKRFKHRATETIAALDAFDEAALDPGDSATRRLGSKAIRAATDLVAHRTSNDSVAVRIAKAWRCDSTCIDTMLIICADHEINVSTFTARCIASAGASVYAAVIGGISAMKGSKHGGAYSRIDALLGESRSPQRLKSTIRSRIARGETLPGFSHPLYPEGDVRAKLLFGRFGGEWVDAIQDIADSLGLHPTVDLAMSAVGRDSGLPAGAPASLFVIGRMVGWVAHYQEQVATQALIRPRARYVGPPLD